MVFAFGIKFSTALRGAISPGSFLRFSLEIRIYLYIPKSMLYMIRENRRVPWTEKYTYPIVGYFITSEDILAQKAYLDSCIRVSSDKHKGIALGQKAD